MFLELGTRRRGIVSIQQILFCPHHPLPQVRNHSKHFSFFAQVLTKKLWIVFALLGDHARRESRFVDPNNLKRAIVAVAPCSSGMIRSAGDRVYGLQKIVVLRAFDTLLYLLRSVRIGFFEPDKGFRSAVG